MNSESLGSLPIRQPSKKAEVLKDNSSDSKNGVTQQMAAPNQCCSGACELSWKPAQEAELKTS